MNEMANYGDKRMTVREVAEVLGCDERTIQRHIKDICPQVVQNGKPTYLNQVQVTEIKLRIERSGRNDLDNVVELPKTLLEKKMLVKQAMDILNDEIVQLTIERDEANRKNAILMHDLKTYTATEIAKECGLRSAIELNKILSDKKIQFRQNNTWVLYSSYSSLGYTDIKQTLLDNGKIIYDRHFTQEGRAFILNLLGVN